MQPASVVELGLEGFARPAPGWRPHAAGRTSGFCRLRSRFHYDVPASPLNPAACAAAGNASCRVPAGLPHPIIRRPPELSRSHRAAEGRLLPFSPPGSFARDIDGDADQVQAGIGGAPAEFAAHPQPKSSDRRCAACGRSGRCDLFSRDQLIGDREQVDVVGFYQRVDLAEGQESLRFSRPRHREHRLRPEDSARRVPVP